MCRWKRGVKAALNTTKTTSNTSTWRTLFRCLCSCFCLFVETKIRWLSGNYHHLEAETLPSNSFSPGSVYHMSTYSLSDLEALRSDLFESERLSMTFHTWAGYGWIANCFRWHGYSSSFCEETCDFHSKGKFMCDKCASIRAILMFTGILEFFDPPNPSKSNDLSSFSTLN